MQHASPAAIIFLIIFILPVLFYIYKAKMGKNITVRRIPGVDAIDEAIGRTIELGRPISFTSGLTGVNPLLFAVLGILRHVARKAALFNSRLFVPCSDSEALVLTDATLQNAYRSEKKFSNYDPTSLRFLSEDQFAFASGYMGIIHREHVGSAFLFGRFAAESLILAEAGQQVGAMQVAGTTSPEQIPFFLATCDYTLIGEELFAAGAYLSKDPVQTGSLRGQDIGKLFLLAVILIGILQATYYSLLSGEPHTPIKTWIEMSWSDLDGLASDFLKKYFG